jgi:hypothetical protein
VDPLPDAPLDEVDEVEGVDGVEEEVAGVDEVVAGLLDDESEEAPSEEPFAAGASVPVPLPVPGLPPSVRLSLR